jgi:glycosyl transferase family 87
MSGAMTTTAAGSQGGAEAPQEGNRSAWLSPVSLAIALTTLVAFGLRLYLLIRPGVMSVTQYDDGPYLGSAVRLIHGVLPYRDFAFVQPPGITLLMGPAALLSFLTGTAWSLVVGRVLTVLAGTAAVVLGGLLVRHRGILAVLLTCGIIALYPPGAASSHTVLLEPWLVLFSLAGAVTVFDGDRVTGSVKRLAWGGVLFGFAGAIKAWAIVPVLIIAVLCLPRLRRAAVFVGGVAAGFLVTILPFAIASPRLFYNDVVVAQLARIGHRAPALHRLASMIGIPGALHWTKGTVLGASLALLAFVIIVQAAAWLVTRRPPPPLDWFATLSAALIVAIFLWPPYFASHYSAFLGPFLAMSLTLPVSRLVTGLSGAARRQAQPGRAGEGGPAAPRRPGAPVPTSVLLARAGLVLLAVAIVAGAVAQAPKRGLSVSRSASPRQVSRLVPPGACVATDQASYLLLANRFTSSVPGCSQMVDGLGTDLALSGGRRPDSGAGKVPAVAAAWHHAFSEAGYVLLSNKNNLRIPWTPRLMLYFDTNFTPILRGYGFTLYKRTAP